MKGYKAFKSNLTCRDYQFTINETHVFDGKPVLCAKGFHFCTDLQDIVKYYSSPTMRVFEIEASGIITKAEEGCTKRACSEIKLVRELSLDEVMLSITKSEPAYWWAKNIGNNDMMIGKITDSEYAYWWAYHIGNQDIMKLKVTESEYAFWWAYHIGNQDIMKLKVTESEYAFWWAYHIGNQDIMIDRITESKYAYYWAKNIGNVDIMKSRVTELEWIKEWNYFFRDDQIN